jgi:hypothetical protein
VYSRCCTFIVTNVTTFTAAAETKNCEEKVQDAEEAHKAEIIKLKVRFESFRKLEKLGKGGGGGRWSRFK